MRVAGTATLLADGRVLLAGGASDAGALATIEAFDPAAGTFTAAGQLTEGRALHSATLLDDGRVLMAGGGIIDGGSSEDSPPPLRTAELYDPATGTSTPTGELGGPRSMHVATLLADGSVLLTGGSEGTQALATAERYDPAAGTFTASGTMTAARALHTATLLGDGSVLIIGGLQPGATEDADPVLLRLDRALRPDDGLVRRDRHAEHATRRPYGHAAVGRAGAGRGWRGSKGSGIASAELIDPATGTSSPTGSMATPRGLHSAALLASGDVLIVGGELDQVSVEGADPLGTPEVYSPASGTFQAVAR